MTTTEARPADFDPLAPETFDSPYATYTRLRLFAPSADRCVRSGFRRALAYVNAQAIPVADARADRSLDRLVLRDAGGRRLYVPFGCRRGTCPQYAADIGNPAFRAHWIAEAGETLSQGYKGLFVDDVNMEFRVGNGSGTEVAPQNPRTGRAMTSHSARAARCSRTSPWRAKTPTVRSPITSRARPGGAAAGCPRR